MKLAFGALLLCFFNLSSMSGQLDSIKVWLDLTKDQDGLTSVKGNAKNLSHSSYSFSYKLKAFSSGPSGRSSNTQAGDFTLSDNEEKVLSTTNVKLMVGQVLTVKLLVFDGEREVASDSLTIKFEDVANSLGSEERASGSSDDTVVRSEESNATNAKDDGFNDDLEINGLIIDETRSKAGRDFYDLFYRKWQDLEVVDNYSITLKEDPTQGRIARLSIEVNGDLVFQPVLQPREEILELVSDQAITVVQQYFLEQKQINLEIESKDQAGSGVY